MVKKPMKPAYSENFKLDKLYLDCIDDHGNCFIIYRAKLKFYFIQVTYSELIFSDTNGVTIEKKSLKKTREPLIKDLLLLYDHFLQIKGSWKRAENPLPLLSFKEGMNNELIWNCHHPKALTEIEYEKNTYTGFGYAETLSLTIKPWNLPIEELKWGRFLSDNYTITWIDWKGSNPQHKIFCNGIEYNDTIFEADRIIFGDGVFCLIFTEIRVIREGKLSNIFSKMPWLKIILNRRMLNTTEIKYKAKSTLNLNREIKASGWSLYEIVIWGK
jgi:hypothetical protein